MRRDNELTIDGLTKRYGEITALDGMTFAVRGGEIFGFVGSNGAGKTTTMRIILGVLAADSGEVRFGGSPIDAAGRRRIGYMPEERGLYPKMKVGAQLTYLARLHGMTPPSAEAAARTWTERLGVAARWNDEVQALSLGNQQRVQLAAALVFDPAVLVLDEPFSGLDPVAVDVMSAVLAERAAAGVPVIFSSHQLDLVQRICHRVGIVKSGRMVANGTVDELRASAPAQLRVAVAGAPPGWAAALPGVRVLGESGAGGTGSPGGGPGGAAIGSGSISLELDPGVDDQQVLRAALAHGPVSEFSWRRPDLVELFRHVVADEEVAA